jgi:cytochrome o ubiquinol oxidase subunit 3
MSAAHHDDHEKTIFGFWVYLITDFMLFGSLFAVYIVLQGNLFGGPSSKELFNLPFATIQSVVMLLTAFTAGMSSHMAHQRKRGATLGYLAITWIYAAFVLARLLQEFIAFQSQGHGWEVSGFLSAYYSLNGMFALHLIFGLIWTGLVLFLVYQRGFNEVCLRRISCLKMFWQFLNIVWIFIYSIVYVLGVF